MSIIATPNLTITAGAPPAGLGDPDLTQVMAADITDPVARIDPEYATWQALSPRTQASGWTFTEPTGGLQAIKITSATVPYSNNGMTAGQGYCDGGNPMSNPWQSGDDWYVTVATFQGTNQRTWLVDLKITGTPTLSNWRELTGSLQPQADLSFSFSNNASVPQVAYIVNGNNVHRIITESGSMAIDDTGNFPWSIGAVGASPWLVHDMNDDWFVSTSDSGTCRVWQSSTDTKRTSSYNPNEGRMSRDGLYVFLSNVGGDRYRCWNLAENTYSSSIVGITQHGATLRSRMAGGNWDSGNPRTSWKATPTAWDDDIFGFSGTSVYGDAGEVHGSGHWIQTGGLDTQYALNSATHSGNIQNWCKTGMVLFNLDGTDARFVGCTYCADYDTGSDDYYSLPWANINPSGHVVTFTSKMAYSNTAHASRYDLFALIMPRAS